MKNMTAEEVELIAIVAVFVILFIVIMLEKIDERINPR